MAYAPDGTTLWLFTSLSSGSSQIVTATSRLETILKANKIEFKALDVATDDKARTLWGRRAGKRKLPGLVRDGLVLADINEVEEWNEYGEIKEMLALEGEEPAAAPAAAPTKLFDPKPTEVSTTSSKETGSEPAEKPQSPSSAMSPLAASMQQIGFQAAEKAKGIKTKLKPSSPTENKEKTKSSETTTEATEAPSKTEDAKAPETTGASGAAEAATKQTLPTDSDKSPEAKPEAGQESESAVESTNLLTVESTDSIPLGGSEPTRHRGSNLSAASAEEIAEVEEATKIEEQPEDEEAAQVEDSIKPPERQVSAGAEKQDLVQGDDEDDYDNVGTDASAEERQYGDSHVKFIGEAPGQEMDRVKATLEGKNVAESAKDQAAATPAPGEKATPAGEQSDKETESTGVGSGANAEARNATGKGDDEAAQPSSSQSAAANEKASDPGEILPGTKTQEPAAVEPKEAGESVAD